MKQPIRFWNRMATGLLTMLVASGGFMPAYVQCAETDTAPAAEVTADAACGQDDLLYNYMLQRSGVTPGMNTSGMKDTIYYSSGISAGAQLTGLDAKVYKYLKQEIIKVAAGERTSTSIEIPLEEIGVSKGPYSAKSLGVDAVVVGGKISENAMQVLYQKVTFDPDKVLAALRNDCPYEMFWRNTKPSYNCRFTSGCDAKYESSEYRLYLMDGPKIDLYVNVDYAVSGAEKSTTIDTKKLAAVQKAIANAQKIVNDNKSKSGKALLEAYRDSICELTSYNHELADQKNDAKYGDPWQLVYVFDGDSSTKVVCEGYAKAFKYLCDLSAERLPNISCLIATGISSEPAAGGAGEGHMWNIVNMEDNRSYLVDITACDHNDGMPSGWVDTFFLSCPASGSYDTGYEFVYDSGMLLYDPNTNKTVSKYISKYTYNEETLNCYAVKHLILSDKPYGGAAADTTTTSTTTRKPTTTTTTTSTTAKPTATTITTSTTRKPTTTTTTTSTTRKPTTTTTSTSTTRKPTTTTTSTSTTRKPTTTTTTTSTTRKPTTTTTTTSTTRKPTTTTTTTSTTAKTTTTTTTTTTSETTATTKTLVLPQNEFKLRSGTTYTIPQIADAQIYQTSDPEIAVVSDEGIIMALKTGTVLISVEDKNGNGTHLRVEVVAKDAVPYPKGDVTGDTAINAKDAAAVLIAAAQNGTKRPNGLTKDQISAADADGDGVINAKDAAVILRYAAAIGTGFKQKIEDFV